MKKFNCVLLGGDKVQVHAEDKSSANLKCSLRFGAPAKVIEEVFEVIEKAFDITQHEWSDADVSFVSTNGYTVSLDVNDCGINHGLYLNKSDIIAIAKHFKLTVEDLK